jgi:hypothetical protein
MSTVFLDPVQMDATAGHIGDHVRELTALVADLESAGSAVVPASLAGWLVEELHDIAVTAQLIALVYSLAALDTAQRAQQIQADQTLATAAPRFTDAPLVGGFVLGTATLASTTGASSPGSGLFLGAQPTSGAVSYAGLSSEAFAAQNAPWPPNSLFRSGGSSGLPLFDIPGYASTNTMLLSTPGRTYLGNNIYEGSGSTGAFHAVLPDPGRDY